MNDKKLLSYFYENCKKYDNEKFNFLIYPDVNKYKYVISNYGRIFSFVKNKEKKPKFSKEDENKIKKMILEGYSSTEIIKEFGGKNSKTQPGKRIYDKIQNIKKSRLKFND